jgi:branched-subunit amino acid ABC-type transport system permease component
MEAACFIVGGIASAIVGFLIASEVPIRADQGLDFALKAFLVMGFVGLDRPLGGAIGGLVLGMTEAVLLDHLNSGVTNAVLVGALIVWLVGREGVRAPLVREF